jgi:glycerol uptake facilitator-like aquaporin
MDVTLRAAMRPTGADGRAALVECGLTTAFMAAVYSLVRWGTGTMTPGATVTELRVRVIVVSVLVGLVIVGFAVSPPGRFSGAHMNPAITLGLFASGSVPARRVLPYLAAQGAGSIAAALITRLLWGPVVSERSVRWAVVQPGPGWTGTPVALAEAATLAVIVALMCWVAARRPAWSAAWIVGGLFGLQGAVLGTLTGGSANPVRQLGPALFSGELHLLGVYLIAPVVGGALAGWTARGFRAGLRSREARNGCRTAAGSAPGQRELTAGP